MLKIWQNISLSDNELGSFQSKQHQNIGYKVQRNFNGVWLKESSSPSLFHPQQESLRFFFLAIGKNATNSEDIVFYKRHLTHRWLNVFLLCYGNQFISQFEDLTCDNHSCCVDNCAVLIPVVGFHWIERKKPSSSSSCS